MGVYAITGGSSGIGAKTVELLKEAGHEVINIDLKDGDICVNLATPEGRQQAVDALHRMHPEGLDGMICNAGVSGACGNLKLIISLNYFGTVALARGVYDLLEKKHGNCVVTASNTISQGAGRMDVADLLNNIGDEQRILNLVDSWDGSNLSVGNSIYVSTNAKMALNALPIPTKYGQETLMDPEEIASVIVFLASPASCGVNGNIMFVDGGTDALLNTEKVY